MSKTGLSPTVANKGDHLKAIPLLQFCGFICGVCSVLICYSSVFLLVPQKSCTS